MTTEQTTKPQSVPDLAALLDEHQPRVWTFSYGGSRLHCSCDDETVDDSESYIAHLVREAARAACTCTATDLMDLGDHADGCPGSAA